ncbi:MAG: hypothetical protein M0011_00190 [Elusimicrobia bacterium]|nr:hypothetical protein [Elusimicrobiota bacterium]
MKTRMAVVAVLTVAAGVFFYTRPHSHIPSDLRDAPADNAIGQLDSGRSADKLALPVPVTARAGANVLAPAKAIQLRAAAGQFDPSAYSVSMAVTCSYLGGIWAHQHDCGSRAPKAELTADGRLLLPAIEAFDGRGGSDPANFDLTVTLRKKSDGSTLFTLGARGRDGLAAYALKAGAISLVQFDPARVEVFVEGKPLAGSELSRDKIAVLMAFLDREHTSAGDIDQVILDTPLTGIRSFDNAQHSYPKTPLSQFQALEFERGVIAEWADSPRPWALSADLRLSLTYTVIDSYRGRAEITKTVDGLARIGRIDLKKKN